MRRITLASLALALLVAAPAQAIPCFKGQPCVSPSPQRCHLTHRGVVCQPGVK